MRWSLHRYDVQSAGDRDSALALVRRFEPAVATVDLGLPPDPDGASEGLATIEHILALAPQTKIIVVTGNQERQNAIKAIGLGAYDFYQKPFEPEILTLMLERAFKMHELQSENRRLATRELPEAGIITRDPAMLKVCALVEKVAPSTTSVLLTGESGTGKELLARALHSTREGRPFIAINCAAIPENLLESELFGYEKGAYTGAGKQTRGRIEYANGGTLFLDEIGDLSFALQAKLLRFLQERVLERVGGREQIAVDVRVVCATHRNLKELIVSGRFREDLYYRLSEIVIDIPPLRSRDGDAALLAHALVKRHSQTRSPPRFSEQALAAIENHVWPGNVREMENCIKRAIILCDGKRIEVEHLGLAAASDAPVNLRQVREAAEKKAVIKALSRVEGSVSRAAELLGVSRPTLYDLMQRYGIK